MSKIEYTLSGHAYDLVAQALNDNDKNYLEIGVFNGKGFAETATRFPKKKCYAVDPFIEDGWTIGGTGRQRGEAIVTQEQRTLRNIEGIENISLCKMTSKTFFDDFFYIFFFEC